MKKRLHERMSVSLDPESVELLEKLQAHYGTSKSGVIRDALKYLNVITEKGDVSVDSLRAYLDLLVNGDHVILDVENWNSLFSDVEEFPEEFWDKVYEIGKQHWDVYYDKGLQDVEDILNYIENTNWYSLSKDSEGVFTLVLKERSSKKFVRLFLKGIFDGSHQDVELSESYRKIRVHVR